MNYDTHLLDKDKAANYDEGLTDKKHYYLREMHIQEAYLLRNLIRKYNPKKALDFACGTGRITQILNGSIEEPYGTDISEATIEIARKKCPKTKFLVADYINDKKMPLKDLDAIFSFRFLLNTPHREKTLSMFFGALRKGGYLFFDIHRNKTSFMGLVVEFKHLLSKDRQKNTLSIYGVKKLLNNNGFKLIDYYGFGILPHYRNITLLPKSMNTSFEKWISNNKLLRELCFDILYIAKKA